MLLANSAEKFLGDSATKGMSMRELRIDPFGLTPRIRCDHKIPRMSVASGRLLQEEAEELFELFIQGLQRLCVA